MEVGFRELGLGYALQQVTVRLLRKGGIDLEVYIAVEDDVPRSQHLVEAGGRLDRCVVDVNERAYPEHLGPRPRGVVGVLGADVFRDVQGGSGILYAVVPPQACSPARGSHGSGCVVVGDGARAKGGRGEKIRRRFILKTAEC